MKYNLSEIMKRAWVTCKKAGVSFADALRFSWACAKKAVELKVADRQEEYGKVSFNLWVKYGRIRAYYRCSWYSKYSNSKSYNFVEM